MTEFKTVYPLRAWLQMVIPLVYDESLSYYELLSKITKTVNQLIENNNMLPEYLVNLIKEYITSGEIEKILQEVLANFMINVKYPPNGLTPAVGDGTADDSDAIQGTIDYVSGKGGGAIYFPQGTYLCHDIQLKNNVSIFGYDRYTTQLIGRGGAQSYVLGGNASSLTISGLTIDGNGEFQVRDVDGIALTGSNYLLTNLILKDSYRNLYLMTTSGHVQMTDIVTYAFTDQSISVDGLSQVQAINIICNESLSSKATGVVFIGSNNGKWKLDIFSAVTPSILVSGQGNEIEMRTISSDPVAPENSDNNIYITNKSMVWSISDMVKLNIGSVTINVLGESNINLKTLNITSDDVTRTVNGNSTTNISQTDTTTSTSTVLNTKDYYINATNPIHYNNPIQLNEYFQSIKFQGTDGIYDVLVNGTFQNQWNGKVTKVINSQPVNVLWLGFDNTGSTDIYPLFQQYTQLYDLYFPVGQYRLDKTVVLKNSVYGVSVARGVEWNKESINRFSSFTSENFDGQYFLEVNSSTNTIMIHNLFFDCYNGMGAILYDPDTFTTLDLSGITIWSLKNTNGIACQPTATNIKAVWGSNITIFGQGGETNGTGIYFNVNATDCKLDNVMIMAVQTSIRCEANILYGNNFHLWCGQYNDGAPATYFSVSSNLNLNNTKFVGSNIYLDTAQNNIYAINSLVNISGLMVWTDNNALTANSRSLAYTQNSKVYINGGYIFTNNLYAYLITDNCVARDFTIYSDFDFKNNIFYYPCFLFTYLHPYFFTGETPGTYVEVIKGNIQGGGYSEFSISDNTGNACSVLFNGNTANHSIVKVTHNGSTGIYLTVEGNIFTIYWYVQGTEIQVTPLSQASIFIDYTNLKTSTGGVFPRGKYTSAPGVEIMEKN